MSPYVYNSSNELMSTPAATFTYDSNGNMLTKIDSSGTATYNWDFENRLTSVVMPSGTSSFKYDPFGRRIQRAVTQSSTTTVTNYLTDARSSILEVDANGNSLRKYTNTQEADEPLAEIRSGPAGFYHQDALGSITSLSGLTGTLSNTYSYDTFGNLVTSTGSISNPFQYTGRDYDAETELRYHRARYYDSTTARFLNEDPTGFAAGINFYPYVLNNPVNFADPSGLNPTQGVLPWLGGGGGTLTAACFASGTCEAVVVCFATGPCTTVAVGVGVVAGGYLAYNHFAKKRERVIQFHIRVLAIRDHVTKNLGSATLAPSFDVLGAAG